jgi:acetolactate synthase-1/2/3 large subunit
MGPVHLALPSDVARREERGAEDAGAIDASPPPAAPSGDDVARMAAIIRQARRPVLLVGLDLDPATAPPIVRRAVDALGVPVFVTPKAKGIVPEDHPLFCGVCAGVAGDGVIVDFLAQSDLLVGLGYDPVESDKLWHSTMRIVSIGPLSIAAGRFKPAFELIGEFGAAIAGLLAARAGPYEWTTLDIETLRADLLRAMRPVVRPERGVSPYELTRRLRERAPRETIMTTDVGSVKFVVSQAWTTYEPLTFLESNGLSAMGYGLPAAMAAKVRFPDRPVICTIGDGGMGMMFADLETCVRERLNVVTVVYNDNALSLIRVAQARRGHPDYGVRYGSVDFAAAAQALGAWGRRVTSLEDLDHALAEALRLARPTVIDVLVDPAEYDAHAAPPKTQG